MILKMKVRVQGVHIKIFIQVKEVDRVLSLQNDLSDKARFFLKNAVTTNSKRYMNPSVHCSIIYSCQDMGTV